MRPATFWRRDRFRLCTLSGSDLETRVGSGGPAPRDGGGGGGGSDAAVVHADRCLVVVLKPVCSSCVPGERGGRTTSSGGCRACATKLVVVNCHLSASSWGARRRLQQVELPRAEDVDVWVGVWVCGWVAGWVWVVTHLGVWNMWVVTHVGGWVMEYVGVLVVGNVCGCVGGECVWVLGWWIICVGGWVAGECVWLVGWWIICVGGCVVDNMCGWLGG